MGAVLDVVRVLFEPTTVFERVRERPRFVAPVGTITLLSVMIGLLTLPYIKAALGPVLAQAATARGGPGPDVGMIAIFQVIASAVFVPIFVALAGGILWVVVSLFGEDAKYRLLTSVAGYTSIMYILQLAMGFVVLSIRGVESIASPLDLQPAFGLDLLAPDATGYVGGVLRGINVFSVWGLILNGIGITTTHHTSKATGYSAAAVAFVVTVLFVSLFALLQPKSPG
ncbi:MAG: YIP1 family protein [Gemmatimonadales bacterium]